ncbi:FUSC family protein [Marinicrinis sediminis]|uniref:Aromatic acid exporter family protein n=1 Tax=Marinicrinis sediminis TaxID=1652465 RepID=A0ABW5RDU1_9BACL
MTKGASMLYGLKWLSALTGKRLIKTALSVFITASVCQFFGWPVIFAVIAAIVTVEPTVNASIQKGKIRLPAAAMGAAIAMGLDAALGQTPLAYALSAFFTIYFCHLFKWDDAIIVATLTAVNMITMTETHYLLNFFVRLGTTSTGIVISILVNFLIFPPNFQQAVRKAYQNIFHQTHQLLEKCLDYHLKQSGSRMQLNRSHQSLLKEIDRCMNLVQFQFQEYRYHRTAPAEIRELKRIQQNVHILYSVAFHTGDFITLSTDKQVACSRDEETCIWQAWEAISNQLLQDAWSRPVQENALDAACRVNLMHLVHDHTGGTDHDPSSFSKEASIAYELLAIYRLLEGLHPLGESSVRTV